MMNCPRLESRDPSDPVCRRRAGVFVPSDAHLFEFCTTIRYRRCPLYVEHLAAYADLCRLEAERAVG
jgi:hypothetical protein